MKAVSDARTIVVDIPTAEIADWDSFHTVFTTALGFPDFYGRNMDAWIDCLFSADDLEARTIDCPVQPGELLTLRIDDADGFARRCPEQYQALMECTAFVNHARLKVARPPLLSLMLAGSFSSS